MNTLTLRLVAMALEEINAYNREYYQRNRQHLLLKQAEKNKRAAKKRREWFIAY